MEHSTFTQLHILHYEEGNGKAVSDIPQRLASLLADKWNQTHSSTFCWACSQLSFSLLHLAVQFVNRAPSSCGRAIISPSSMLMNSFVVLTSMIHTIKLSVYGAISMLVIREISYFQNSYITGIGTVLLLLFLALLCMFCLE